jgi:hypothetical protein
VKGIIEIPCSFSDVYHCVDNIDEELLLKSIPDKYLPVPANEVLILVSDKYGCTGQCGLEKFRNWSKYYDCYSLELLSDDYKEDEHESI